MSIDLSGSAQDSECDECHDIGQGHRADTKQSGMGVLKTTPELRALGQFRVEG